MVFAPGNLRITLLFLLLFAAAADAQVTQLQSLLTQLKAAETDRQRAQICYSISRYYWSTNPDSVLLMGNRSLEFAKKAGNDTSVALAYLTMGVAYGAKAQYPQALDCDLKALRFSEKAGMEGLSGNNFTNIGIVYAAMDEFREAADYLHRALDIAIRNREDSTRVGVAIGYINLGDMFWQQTRFDSAVYYGRMALPIVNHLADSSYLAITLSNLGRGFSGMRLSDSAIIYAKRARVLFANSGDSAGVAETDNTMAEAWRQQGKAGISLGYAQEAWRLAGISHDHEVALNACKILNADYEALGDYKAASVYLRKEIGLRDSVFTLAKEKQIKSLQSGYDLEKKQQEVALLEEENALRKIREERNRDLLLVFAISFVLLAGACVLLIRGMRQKQRLNKLLKGRNQEILARNKELGSLNAVKNKLFSIIGHDLRSPIATLKGFVALLEGAALTPEKISFFAAKMQESLSATAYLLDNLLFWAKSQMEGMTINRHSFDLLPLLEQNRQLAQLRAEAKKVTIALEVPPGISTLPVTADNNMIDLVVRNLLENAYKFSYESGVVTLGVTTNGAEIQVSVKDNGKGIATADQEKIRAGMLSFTTMGTANEKGSGLGLFLCQELVQKNDGRFWFESQEGKGSVFYFSLGSRG